MSHLRTAAAVMLAGALVLAGCSPKPAPPPANQNGQVEQSPRHPELTAPLEGALKALKAMHEAGERKEIAAALEQHQAFRSHWQPVKAELDKIDPKLAVHIEDGAIELDLEFKKPPEQFRFFELGEEAVKLGRLLSKAAELLGTPIDQTLVVQQPATEIPFNKEQQVKVTLSEHKISPEVITVDQHTKVTFVITNMGKEVHEFALDHYAVEVEEIKPGETKELTLVLLDAGEFETVCYLPGHYEVGMHGTLKVLPQALQKK